MIARIGALVAAVALILGAWFIRDRVIDDDDAEGDSPSTTPPNELICITELEEICRSLDVDEIEVRIEHAGTTLDQLAELEQGEQAPMWVTFDPFPEMVDVLRAGSQLEPLSPTSTPVASSSIALVMPHGRAEVLVPACGDPVDWKCLGDAAGKPWSDIGGDEAWRRVRPGFASAETSAIGLLGFAQAVAGYFGDAEVINVQDPEFVPWVRRLVGAVPASGMSQPTAIGTIQVRPGLLDIAVGAEAELVEDHRDEFEVQYAGPMVRAEVVLASSDGAPVTDEVASGLRTALVDAGWEDAIDLTNNPLPSPRRLLQLRELWKELA